MAINAQQVKSRRVILDRLEKGIEKLNASRETSLAKTKLQEAKMCLGLCLKDMGTINPYPESTNKENATVEPTADVSEKDYLFDATGPIEMVKELRGDIETQVDHMKELYLSAHDTEIPAENRPFFASHLIEALTCLEKSKMWLGMELSRLSDEKNFERPKK